MSRTGYAGKVVWVTGASSGIGESLCYELARSGANLVLSARREGALQNVQLSCERPADHLLLPLDVCQPQSFSSAFDSVLGRFGKVDVLLNGAGMSQRGLALETQLSVDQQLLNLNYIGPVALSKLVLPSMIERKSGQIVVISSLLGKFSVPGRAAYCGSKHAIHGYFDSLRSEIHQYDVSVTIVCPGFIQTNASINALRGDGTPHAQMDREIAGGMPSDECARQIVRAMERRRNEVLVGGREKYAALFSRLAPRLFARVARRISLK